MTTDKNDEGNWLVVAKINGWFKVALTEQAENIARDKAEALALGKEIKTDLDGEDISLLEAVFVYERKGTVKAELVARWL